MKYFYRILLLFMGGFVVTMVFAKGGRNNATTVVKRGVTLSTPFGICQNTYRISQFNSCCIFDQTNVNSINNISELAELIKNVNNTCGYNRMIFSPGCGNAWHGSINLHSLDSNWDESFDLLDKSKVTVNSDLDLLVQVKTNERIKVSITVFEPCMYSNCRRSSNFPRIIWGAETTIQSSETGPIDMLLSETNRSTSGLCN